MARQLPSNFPVAPMHFLGVLCTGTCTGRSTWHRAQYCSFFLDPPVSSTPDNPRRVLASSFEVSKFVPINHLPISILAVNVSLRTRPPCNSSLTLVSYPGNPDSFLYLITGSQYSNNCNHAISAIPSITIITAFQI